MPDEVTDWESTNESCRFTIKGMPGIGMKFKDLSKPDTIVIGPNGKVPFDFDLICKVNQLQPGKSSLQLIFDAKLNPLFKMMLEKPLGNFINMLSKNLGDHNF